MKDFLKYTFATVVGLVLTGIIFSVIGIVALAGLFASASSTTPVSLNDNSVAVIRLNGTLTEQPQEDPLSLFMQEEFPNLSLQQVLDGIAYAKTSPRVKGIHLDAGTLAAPPAVLQEIRDALADFKTSGKFVTAYANGYTQGTYYVCSLADRVMLNPQGSMTWDGLSAETMYYKELLEKLGIEMQIFKVGTYKSAVEPFTSTRMSDANREQTLTYLQSVWDNMVQAVAASRSLPVDTLQAYADQMQSFRPAEELVARKLIDTLIYRNDVKEYMNKTYGGASKQELEETGIGGLAQLRATELAASTHPTIAVYYAEGGIDDASSNLEEGIHAPLMCDDLRELADDPDVKAVVLRVNSPGGSAFGSEQIWHEVERLKAKKPIIVSMGGYAASGGYYISCAADSIVAEPNTLTGSIGIFGMIPNLQGAGDKLGLHFDHVSTNRHPAASLFRPLDPETRTAVQTNIERGYALFVKRCADGRGLSTDSIRSIAEGRVWTGEMAKERGLVDELGGLDTALRIAAEKAGLTDYTIARYPEPEDWLTKLLGGSWTGVMEAGCRNFLGSDYESLRFVKQLKDQAPVQARLPYVVRFSL